MTIKTIQNNETITKQLTELLNNAFDNSLDDAIPFHNTVGMIKNNDEQEVTMDEAILIVELIDSWTFKTYCNSFGSYALLMKDNHYKQLKSVFNETPYKNFVDKELHTDAFKKAKDSYPLFEQTIIPLTMRVKEYKGSIKESLLAVVKPFIINEFSETLIDKLETTIELLSMMNNYNNYDYHLERFISVFEENLMNREEKKSPLELMTVCWLDETFFKETAIPELKKRILTDAQKQKAAIHKSCIDLVHSYYDYCLYYSFAETDHGLTSRLIDTFFFYEKTDFDNAFAIVNKALAINELLDEDEVSWEYEKLLDEVKETKPEWVDDSFLLIVKPFVSNDECDDDDEGWFGFDENGEWVGFDEDDLVRIHY